MEKLSAFPELKFTKNQKPLAITSGLSEDFLNLELAYKNLYGKKNFDESMRSSSLGRYVFGSEISYNKAPPRLPGLGC
jgi:hypothetical protein